ncbi:7193_t:CDS:2 [Cetraspora pellucida]|uniref:7193_t:CDS:1 n=1 Tax=Cetraspora pellucida TaxID=1433469 RepID=A0A9N8YV01_9GLOM|nr:7193_t:CDS:2 [Cetraspora pellucida]
MQLLIGLSQLILTQFLILTKANINISDHKLNETIDRIIDATNGYCHYYGIYNSIAENNSSKKSQLAQKKTKKCECKSYIQVMLTNNSTTVIL